MYHLRRDTLAGIKTSALFQCRDHGGITVTEAMVALREYMASAPGVAQPETEAFRFYAANHVFSMISAKYDQHEPLPEDVATLARGYAKMSSALTVRLMYYVIMIIVRESRHCHASKDKVQLIAGKHGKAFVEFFTTIQGLGEEGAVGHLTHNGCDVSMAEFCTGIRDLFLKGGYSSSYGGKPWANIADTLRKAVMGEISAEAFSDTAFTLAHNNGPMFNKGMLYKTYTSYIYRLLDVQRSGQVPQLFQECGDKGYISSETQVYMNLARAVFPELVGHVDWYKVEALGALHKYEADKIKQVQMYGKSSYASEKDKLDATKYFVGGGSGDYALMVKREAA